MDRTLRWALLLGLAACTPGQVTPTLSGMTPNWGYYGDETSVEITGEGLFPTISVRAGGELDFDRGFRAWLEGPEEVELEGVGSRNYSTLTATVPAGLKVGVYDLRVATPAGDELSLADVFRATPTRADHLEVLAEDSVVDIDQYAVVQVRVLDTNGQLVQTPLPVTVTLVVEGQATVTLSDDPALDEQRFDPIEGVVTGSLGADGIGSFAVAADQTTQVAVLVSPAELDSVVDGDMVLLSFEPGPVASVKITLPDDLDDLRAGDTLDVTLQLLDELGHQTSGTQAALYLRESCPGGDLSESLYVLDVARDVPVTITGATNLDCEQNSLVVSGVADGATFEGESETFQVAPGEPEHLDLIATPAEVEAGTEPLTVWVWVEDAYDNVVEDYDAELSLEDSVGGLDPGSDVGVQSCRSFSTGPAFTFCQAWLWRASEDVQITGRDTNGNTGKSNKIVVQAGELANIQVSLETTTVVAGEPLEVTVTGVDALGNRLSTDPSMLGTLKFRDDHKDLTCTNSGGDDDGAVYLCTLTLADADDHITVTLTNPELELSSTTEPFAIINGPLQSVRMTLGDSVVEAGEALSVALTGRDAFGNAYQVGGDRDVALADLSGTLSLGAGGASVTLDGDGEATATARFTSALVDNQILASQGGESLGESATFDVIAGPLSGFSVEPEATFGWVGEPLSVTISAVDEFDNPITDFDAPAELRSSMGWGDTLTFSAWDSGVIEAEFLYSSAGLGDTLDLWVDGALEQRSITLDALDDACPLGPTAALTVAGSAPATLCLSGGSTPTTVISTVGSAAGSAPLTVYHFDLGDHAWQRGASNAVSTTWSEAGGYRVSAVVADARGCADLVQTEVYVGAADGQPTGPLVVSLDDSTLNAGVDTATVTVLALDCAGDPANGALLAWADLGAVQDSGASAVTASGAGLSVEVLDGEAEMSWSMVDTLFDGEATLRVGTASGSSFGDATATVSGDTSRPLVLSVDPAGTTTDPFESIKVRFSEAIPSRYLSGGTVVLVERSGAAVTLLDPVMSEDDTVAKLGLSAAVTPGVYVLTLTTDVRDGSGNRLDGAWRMDGTATNFTLTFGDVSDSAPAVTGCGGDVATFRPDGDPADSLGDDPEEADELTLTTIATGTPSWWRFSVADADGADVLVRRVSAASGRGTLSWDGRDQAGFIVDNGAYVVTVTAEDAYWNSGTSCTTSVTIDNRVVGIP